MSRSINPALFLDVAESLAGVTSVKELIHCIETKGKSLLHQEALLIALHQYGGDLNGSTVFNRQGQSIACLDAGEPKRFLGCPGRGSQGLSTHVHLMDVNEWLACASLSSCPQELAGKSRRLVGLSVDSEPTRCSFEFLFFGFRVEDDAYIRKVLTLIAPHLRDAVTRIACLDVSFFATRTVRDRAGTLTPREREVLEWIRQGKTNSEIASILGVAYKTVKNQVQSILVKLRVNNRAQAVAAAMDSDVFMRLDGQGLSGFSGRSAKPNRLHV